VGEPGELAVGFDDEAVQDIERADEADAAQVVAEHQRDVADLALALVVTALA
jgi:hypothetical protein